MRLPAAARLRSSVRHTPSGAHGDPTAMAALSAPSMLAVRTPPRMAATALSRSKLTHHHHHRRHNTTHPSLRLRVLLFRAGGA